MERVEAILMVALAGFLILEIAVVGVLRQLGAGSLTMALTAVVLPPPLGVAWWIVSAINGHRDR